jgi:translocation protein SEC63
MHPRAWHQCHHCLPACLPACPRQAHLLLLAYLGRAEHDIPVLLKGDLVYVLQKSPLLLSEMAKIACFPRPPHGYGWMVSVTMYVLFPFC